MEGVPTEPKPEIPLSILLPTSPRLATSPRSIAPPSETSPRLRLSPASQAASTPVLHLPGWRAVLPASRAASTRAAMRGSSAPAQRLLVRSLRESYGHSPMPLLAGAARDDSQGLYGHSHLPSPTLASPRLVDLAPAAALTIPPTLSPLDLPTPEGSWPTPRSSPLSLTSSVPPQRDEPNTLASSPPSLDVDSGAMPKLRRQRPSADVKRVSGKGRSLLKRVEGKSLLKRLAKGQLQEGDVERLSLQASLAGSMPRGASFGSPREGVTPSIAEHDVDPVVLARSRRLLRGIATDAYQSPRGRPGVAASGRISGSREASPLLSSSTATSFASPGLRS